MAKTGTGTAFGDALRRALDGRKVPWLENATGIDRQRLHRLIMGRGKVTLEEGAAIATALNVPVEVFLPPAVEEPAVLAEEEETPVPFVSVPHTLETRTTVSAS